MIPAAVVKAGEALPDLVVALSRRTFALFAGASGDHQPVHIDIDAARARGLEDVFAPGMLIMGLASRTVVDSFAPGSVRSYRARFVAVTPVNAVVAFAARVAEIIDGNATIEISAALPDGTIVLTGTAIVRVG